MPSASSVCQLVVRLHQGIFKHRLCGGGAGYHMAPVLQLLLLMSHRDPFHLQLNAGQNHVGQLGDGTTNAKSVPTPVSGGLTFSHVSLGVRHTCGLVPSPGTVYCWGE